MILSILFGLMLLVATTYGFFNFGMLAESEHHSFVPVVVLSTMFTVMFTAISIYLYRNHKIRSISHWSYTQGRITRADLIETFWGPRVSISYSYFINDIEYQNSDFDYFSKDAPLGQIFMMPGLRDVEKISELEGKMVRVYFKSLSPYTSYISADIVQNPLIVLLPSMIIIPSCLFMFARILGAI